MAAAAVGFLNFKFLTAWTVDQEGRLASLCLISSKSVEPRPRYNNFLIFRRWRPSAILDLYACVGTTHEGHLVVFIAVQNLVVIDAAVLILCTFFYLVSLAWKRLFTPQDWVFVGVLTPKWEAMWTNPKRHIRARVRVVWAIMRENPSTGLTCRWVLQKDIGLNMCPEAPRGHMCT